MLKASEIERVSMALDNPLRDLEMQIMEDIVRRIKINGEITRSADWQIYRLHELGMSKREIKKAIAENLDLSKAEIKHLFKDILRKGYEWDDSIYKTKGKARIPLEENEGLQRLLSAVSEQTSGELKNISQSLGFAVKQPDGKLKFTQAADFYQQSLDNAIMGIASGAFDYNTVIKKVISDMTNSGLRTVDYATGWSNRADVAARRSVMTGLSQLTAKMNEDNAKELGTDYFEVTWHSGARPSHQEWQGKVYSRKELETICGLGTVTGLCGANCYHDYYPFIPGISERSYTDEELAQMNAEENKPVKYGDKEYTKYEALQRQRKLETAMRAQRQKIHLLEEAGADEEDIINARCRYRGTSQEYTRFSKAMGLPQQRERVNADGLGNIGVGKYSKAVDKNEKYGIMNVGSEAMYRKARAGYIEPMPKKQLHKIEKAFKARGGLIQYGEETDAYLKSKNAEAITYNDKTILLKQNPGRASVFEELIHATQYRNGENDGSYVSRLNCEIEAQKKLLRNSKAYKLTEAEVEQTKIALQQYESELKAYNEKGGD
ncbi:phage minor capsid protein [Ruminococcus sp.]|uniref:phage minor capsid protein n=1 Tax=Ruminococcus sp. TaxID=41978 RepID=UPI00257C0208|nr:phage minor capsid protein [Ruminococcus sp.]